MSQQHGGALRGPGQVVGRVQDRRHQLHRKSRVRGGGPAGLRVGEELENPLAGQPAVARHPAPHAGVPVPAEALDQAGRGAAVADHDGPRFPVRRVRVPGQVGIGQGGVAEQVAAGDDPGLQIGTHDEVRRHRGLVLAEQQADHEVVVPGEHADLLRGQPLVAGGAAAQSGVRRVHAAAQQLAVGAEHPVEQGQAVLAGHLVVDRGPLLVGEVRPHRDPLTDRRIGIGGQHPDQVGRQVRVERDAGALRPGRAGHRRLGRPAAQRLGGVRAGVRRFRAEDGRGSSRRARTGMPR